MRTPLSTLTLLEPRSLREALHFLQEEGPLTPLAGCTDVYVALNTASAPADGFPMRRYLNLWGLRELKGVGLAGDTLRLGALCTYSELIASSLVRRRLPMLVAAAREIGGPQVQNRGTLGGNVANASPAGDTLPVLACAEARVVLRSARSERRVSFAAFYTGYRKTVMRPDELIVAIEIDPVEGRQWFRKVGTRAAQAISKVVLAGVRSSAPRLALGSVGPTVIRATRTEAVLAAGADPAEAARTLQDEIHPIDDMRSTAEYRRRVSANLLARFWQETGPSRRRASLA